MEPQELGKKYSRVAHLYDRDVNISSNGYGLKQISRAIAYSKEKGRVLDVGCGAGGRVIEELEKFQFKITGVDVSEGMLNVARERHFEHQFELADICTWESVEKYDLIIAWDSLFHLPLGSQELVIRKLCSFLAEGGVMLYTFGNGSGDHIDTWHNDTFYYSTIGISENLRLIMEEGLKPLHLELDQFPDQRHAFLIAQKCGAE